MKRSCRCCCFLSDFTWNGAPSSIAHRSSFFSSKAMGASHFWCLAYQSSSRLYQNQRLKLAKRPGQRDGRYSPPLVAKYFSSYSRLFTIIMNQANLSWVRFDPTLYCPSSQLFVANIRLIQFLSYSFDIYAKQTQFLTCLSCVEIEPICLLQIFRKY